MKHLKLLLLLSIVSLLGTWALATIEVQTTTPPVPPRTPAWIVGTFRLIFSNEEFGELPSPATTDYFVLVRTRLSQNVMLKSIGLATDPTTEITPVNWVPLAWEFDGGAPTMPLYNPDAVRLVRWSKVKGNSFFDILFTQNMKYGEDLGVPLFSLDLNNRIRVTVGTPCGWTPNAPFATQTNFATYVNGECADPAGGITNSNHPHTQISTELCCNFSESYAFNFDDFWRVGLTAYRCSDFDAVPGPVYNVNFQPADPSLAQLGPDQAICRLDCAFPDKGDCCNNVATDQTPASAQVCPIPVDPGQEDPVPCGEGWQFETGTMDFGPTHRFGVTEWCPAGHDPEWLYYAGGVLTITLIEPTECSGDLNVAFANQPQVWIECGDDDPNFEIPATYITYTDTTITVVLPPDAVFDWDELRDDPYCLLIDLVAIDFDTCCLLDVLETTAIPVSVTVSYEPPDYVCGELPTPCTIKVGDIYGCEEVEPEPVPYHLYLYYPYLPPVMDPENTWWCGVAITNYAEEATIAATMYFWELDGEPYEIDLAEYYSEPLGGHCMWVFLLDVLPVVPVGGHGGTAMDQPMSAFLDVTVLDTEYPRNYMAMPYLSGALAGVDSFVLMGDNEQAYGYVARHLDGAQWWNDFEGNTPIWAKRNRK